MEEEKNRKLREVLSYALLLPTVGPFMRAARCAGQAGKLAPGTDVDALHALMREQEKDSIGCCVTTAPVQNTVASILAQCPETQINGLTLDL